MFTVMCGCGRRVFIDNADPELRWIRCGCGAEYSKTGETLKESPTLAAVGVFGRIFRGWKGVRSNK